MTDPTSTAKQPGTVRVYLSGYVEYQIDNPAAVVDASKFTPQELDPEGKSNLGTVDPRAWEDINNAVLVEVAKGTKYPTPPGLTGGINAIKYSLAPPD
jgi:hypothetical protein